MSDVAPQSPAADLLLTLLSSRSPFLRLPAHLTHEQLLAIAHRSDLLDLTTGFLRALQQHVEAEPSPSSPLLEQLFDGDGPPFEPSFPEEVPPEPALAELSAMSPFTPLEQADLPRIPGEPAPARSGARSPERRSPLAPSPRSFLDESPTRTPMPAPIPPAGPPEALAAPLEAPGAPSEASGTPSEAPGTPSEASGTPSEASGTPSEASGAPSEAPGTPSEVREAPSEPLAAPPETLVVALDAPAAAPVKELQEPAPLSSGYRPNQVPPPGAPSVAPVVPTVSFFLPNGRADEPYRAIPRPPSPEVIVEGVEIPPDLGLEYQDGLVVGRPAAAGEFKLRVRYAYSDGRNFGQSQWTLLPLTITANPRSLWKTLPSDESDPYHKPDEASDLLELGARRAVAASKRGRSHAHTGQFRDDDFTLAALPSGWVMLAVADGAGSARYSREGSRVAVARSVDFMRAKLEELGEQVLAAADAWQGPGAPPPTPVYAVMAGAAHQAMKAIADRAQAIGAAPRELSTTLLLAACHATPERSVVATFWCGDGAIGLYRQGGGVELLGEADSGEYAGQTRFLDQHVFASGESVQRRLRFSVVPDMRALVLMTDGVSDPLFETEHNLADPERWRAFWETISPHLSGQEREPERSLLGWLDFWSQGNHDDRTLAVLW